MKKKKKAVSLRDALEGLIGSLGMKGKLEECQVVERWSHVVGEQIALHARAVFFDGGKLFVEVDSAAWNQELFHMKKEILKRLDQSLGKTLVEDIIFTNSRR